MINISLPQAPRLTRQEGNKASFIIEGLFPGYGTTVANALRRVVLSSLPGAGVIGVKIKGVDHEFSTIPGVMEDVATMLLNIKKMRFYVHEAGIFEGHLAVKGEHNVTAADFKVPSQVDMVNGKLPIATLTDKKADLQITIWVTRGVGYELMEERSIKTPVQGIGVISVDTLYSPVVAASFNVENMRVQDRTDYNRITFTIETDGTITPQRAFEQAVSILLAQFDTLKQVEGIKKQDVEEAFIKEVEQEKGKGEVSPRAGQGEVALSGRNFISHLKLSSRIEKIFKSQRIKTIAQLAQKNDEELMKIDGIGEAALKEVKRKLGKAGFLLGTIK